MLKAQLSSKSGGRHVARQERQALAVCAPGVEQASIGIEARTAITDERPKSIEGDGADVSVGVHQECLAYSNCSSCAFDKGVALKLNVSGFTIMAPVSLFSHSIINNTENHHKII